jgi:hypothetical protein
MNCKARTLRFSFCCCASTIRLCRRRTLRLARFQFMEGQSTAERRLAPAAPLGAASGSRRIPVLCIVVIEIRSERPRGSLRDYSRRDIDQGDWSQRLSRSLQSGVGFLRDPLPGLPWASLAVGFPRLQRVEEKVGLTTFRVYTWAG